ncbi:MAG: DUF4349 domain-containing protein [Pirellulales bacterium]
MSPTRWILVTGFLAFVIGCGREEGSLPNSLAARSNATTTSQAGEQADETGASEQVMAARRVIRRGELSLEVEDFDPLPKRIEDAVHAQGGFVFSSNISGGKAAAALEDSRGLPSRNGTWTLRVPTERFAALLADLRKLGDVRSTKTSADDVTADYADLESRIRNKQREEERLLKLLADATGRLEEVLTIERELTRVRGEIETAQGRAAMLKDLTDLATLVVTVVEAQPSPPPLPPPLTYFEKLAQVWSTSWERLALFLQGASFILVAVVPWLLFPAAGAVGYYVVRRLALARYAAKSR